MSASSMSASGHCFFGRFFLHQRSRSAGLYWLNGHEGYGSDGLKEASGFPAGAAGAVVDAGADAFGAFVWIDGAEHSHALAVVAMTPWLFSVMFALFARFTVFVPGVLR